MKQICLLTLPLLVGVPAAMGQSRFPDFRAKCRELSDSYNGVDGHRESITFKNFQGRQQNLEIRLILKEDQCSYAPESLNLWIEKVGGAKFEVAMRVAVNPEDPSTNRLYVSSFSSLCETQSASHLISTLASEGVEMNETLLNQVRKHVREDFCPVFDQKVKESVLNALKAM
jgi:hypothetical protein